MQPINGLYVYFYHYDEQLLGWIPVESFQEYGENLAPEFISGLRATLMQCGWEGDGKLGAMMVPPFFSDHDNPGWFAVFHVKQSNNGTSWIASRFPLSTDGLTSADQLR